MTARLGHVVRIERTFAAPAEDVFDAWTSPEVMRRPDGTEVEARGEYTLIDRPHRLAMTWTFDDEPSNEQLIELSFSESAASTTVLLVNSRISTDARRDAQDWGWHGCFDQLERVLAC